jgi:hypothetical protein
MTQIEPSIPKFKILNQSNQSIEIEKQKKDIRYVITEAYYQVVFQKEKVIFS